MDTAAASICRARLGSDPRLNQQQPQYPDWYSHAHPTDSQGRPLPSPAIPSGDIDQMTLAATESAQHDWVSSVTPTDKPAQGTTAAGYAPPHERGT